MVKNVFYFLFFCSLGMSFLQETSAGIKSLTINQHLIIYDSNIKNNKILLFLVGTGGAPTSGPKEFYMTAVAQGYRLIALDYPDNPAVAQVCTPKLGQADCAEKFREKRIFGTNVTNIIPDSPEDCIMARLMALLSKLNETYPQDSWGHYFYLNSHNDKVIAWENFALAGQSQGGGMSEFIAKRFEVSKIISFSGGWDNAGKAGTIASWYSYPSATPAERWYGTYHRQESMADTIRRTYNALKIPDSHIKELNRPAADSKKAHGQGVRDFAYRDIWIEMLGRGN